MLMRQRSWFRTQELRRAVMRTAVLVGVGVGTGNKMHGTPSHTKASQAMGGSNKEANFS